MTALKPPKYVNTVRRLIYWYYAELIAKAAGFEGNYGFVTCSSGEVLTTHSRGG